MLPGANDLWAGNIHEAVKLWFTDQGTADATYVAIAIWNTVAVTSLAHLFCGNEYPSSICGPASILGVWPRAAAARCSAVHPHVCHLR
jgi:hypothetical protein